jgi:hypothetical protein
MAGLALALALSPTASAQDVGQLEITQAPVIVGSPYVGTTLIARGGAWRSPTGNTSRTEAWWEWWRCPRTTTMQGCDFLTRGMQFTVRSDDQTEYVFLVRYVRWRDNNNNWVWRTRISSPAGPLTTAPAPAPTPTPSPTPTPTPTPTFDTTTTVPTTGPVLSDTPSQRRAIRPFPIVRMRGRLTANGARVTLLTVRAPKRAKVTVRCKGSCPASRWSPATRKKKLTRARSFERVFKSGTRISVTVSRSGYIGKRTIFVIRKGRAPSRVDNCLNSRGRVTRCPAGV